jgi:hypothetical protein
MVMRPFDTQGNKFLIAARLETLRGGPLPRSRRGPRSN